MFPINSKIKDKFQIVLLSCHVSGGHSCIFADKLIIYIYMNLKIKKNSYLIYIHTLLVVWVFVCLSVVSNKSQNGGTARSGPIFVWDLPQVIILRKILGNSQESFTGKSSENVNSFFEDFLVTHSEEPGARNIL